MCGAFTLCNSLHDIIDQVWVVVLAWGVRGLGSAQGRWTGRYEQLIARGAGARCVVPGPFGKV